MFYTYLWLREDGTPYYAGKGTEFRAYQKHHNRVGKCPPKDRVILQEFLSEADAFEAEQFLILYYGRKDLGTGCLINMSDGGEGSAGYIPTEAAKQKNRAAHLGKKQSEETIQKRRASLKGVIRTEEWRKNIGLGNKGRKFTDAHKEKLSNAKLGKKRAPVSDETKRKMSEARLAYFVRRAASAAGL